MSYDSLFARAQGGVDLKAAIYSALMVGAGGFIGSVLRYAVSGLVHRRLPLANFPYGTLVVNVTGCLAIGILGGLAESRQMLNPAQRIFLMVGVLGGFTTFSTFGYETLAMARDGEFFRAAAGIAAHVFLCLLAVWLGHNFASSR